MRIHEPLTVVNVSLATSERDFDEPVHFLGRDFRIVRQGTDGSVDAAVERVRTWSGEADTIAVTGAREAAFSGLYGGDPRAVARLFEAAGEVPVTDGHALRAVLQEWAVRHVQQELPGYFVNARTVVLGGHNHDRTVATLRQHTDNIEYADPALRWNPPDLVRGVPLAGSVAGLATWAVGRWPRRVRHLAGAPARQASRALTRNAAGDCDVVVATHEELLAFGLDNLRGAMVITSAVSPERLADLAARDVDAVLDSTPQPFEAAAGVTVSPALLEAMMRALVPQARELGDDDLLEMVVEAGLEPRLLQPNGPRRRSRFAFVIHPLSREFFGKVEPLGTFARNAPRPLQSLLEKGAAYAPPFVYSRVTGIASPTGAEAEGLLISVGGTPKELMAHDPEFTYTRLLQAAEIARRHGAQIMGLGAFTKVVGDAGVTVARKASLPITTGNSYSASAALWAAHDALDRLGLAEVDEQGRIRGAAMVVGATGAIGSVCARLLALASDDLWLVSPETAKLLALKEDIEEESPRARVHVAATADEHLGDMDLVVTATSGAGKRVLDIAAVKPGCVITDVARPLDLSAEDVARRPDVLVIESGEIEVPGEVRMRDIGLPPGVVYACLAETVVLALEGRYETFTVGREIEWEKVKEIYRLGLRHGMGLAAISGHHGVFSDEDIARVRELALERRRAATATPAAG